MLIRVTIALVIAAAACPAADNTPEPLPLGKQLQAGSFGITVLRCCSGIDINNPGAGPIMLPLGYMISVWTGNQYSDRFTVTVLYRQDDIYRRRTHEFIRRLPLSGWTSELFSIGADAELYDVLVSESTPGPSASILATMGTNQNRALPRPIDDVSRGGSSKRE